MCSDKLFQPNFGLHQKTWSVAQKSPKNPEGEVKNLSICQICIDISIFYRFLLGTVESESIDPCPPDPPLLDIQNLRGPSDQPPFQQFNVDGESGGGGFLQ